MIRASLIHQLISASYLTREPKGEIKLMGITVGTTTGNNMISVKDTISENSEKRKHRKMVLIVHEVKYDNIFLQHLWHQIQKPMPRALAETATVFFVCRLF